VQEVLDVPNEVAAELAAIGDGVLTALRERLGCAINLRGNRLTLDGEDTKVVEAKAVVEELVELVESGQEIGAGTVDTIDSQVHDHLRHRSGRHRQDLPRDRARRCGALRASGRTHHPHAAGGRSR
jgi:phosphate starvation-inducible protein PhoH